MTVYAENEGYVLVKTESNYGVDPTLAAPNNLLRVDTCEVSIQKTVIQRPGMSPYAPGYRPVPGPDAVDVTLTCEVSLTPITGSSDRPPEGPMLLAAGFTAVYAAPTNVKRVTYTARSFGATGSAAIERYGHNQADDDGINWQVLGGRFDWSLDINAAERWLWTFTGPGASGTVTATSAGRSTSVDFGGRVNPPSVGGGATCVIKRISSVDGSDVDTYPAAGRVVSLSVSGNNGAQLQQGVCGQRVDFVPSTGPSGTLVVELTDLSDHNPWEAIEESGLYEITISSPAAQAANTAEGQYHILNWTAYVESITMGADAGAMTVSLALSNGYADDTGDGGGLKPADTFSISYNTYTAP